MSDLGINIQQILLQAANFLILLVLLQKFLYEPVMKLIRNRQEDVKETQEMKATLEEKMDQIEKRQKEVITEAREESEKIMEEARQRGEKMAEKIRNDARQDAEELIQKGEEDLKGQAEQMKEEMKREVAEVAVNTAEAVMRERISQEQRQKVMDEAIRRFADDGK